jgi:trehalose utilization protein
VTVYPKGIRVIAKHLNTQGMKAKLALDDPEHGLTGRCRGPTSILWWGMAHG